ncbi:hypothetical protein DRQ09_02730 [candidate division KSB1 bacterium]|mgnify:CR=1 FL=1|nr:MAG: hypothetical protein DRQ09_02730 [candidate division KSB1 bacterium]
MVDKIKDYSFYHKKIKDWPEDERPREKLLKFGSESLTDAELLAILIQQGTGKITALDIAKSLLIEYKNLNSIASKEIKDLKKFKGIGFAKSITLIAAFEIGRRIASRNISDKVKVSSPEEVAGIFIPKMEHLKKEQFRVVLLDSNNQIISVKTITEGILNASIVHVREVFREAIIESSAGIILVHNHPSGNPNPSREDIEVTEKMVETGKIMDIPVRDHLIIAGRKYFSFAEKGILKKKF